MKILQYCPKSMHNIEPCTSATRKSQKISINSQARKFGIWIKWKKTVYSRGYIQCVEFSHQRTESLRLNYIYDLHDLREMITLGIEQRGRILFHWTMTSKSKTHTYSLNTQKNKKKKLSQRSLNEIQNNCIVENTLMHWIVSFSTHKINIK